MTVSLTRQEYEDLVVGVEVVVVETPRYRIVEKFGAAAPVAARLDPRAHPRA